MTVIVYDGDKVNRIRSDLNVTLSKMQNLKNQINNAIKVKNYNQIINNVSNSVDICYNNINNIVNMLDDSNRVFKETDESIKSSLSEIKMVNVTRRKSIIK